MVGTNRGDRTGSEEIDQSALNSTFDKGGEVHLVNRVTSRLSREVADMNQRAQSRRVWLKPWAENKPLRRQTSCRR